MKVPNSALRFHPPMEMGRGRGEGRTRGRRAVGLGVRRHGGRSVVPKGFGGNLSAAGMTRGSGGSARRDRRRGRRAQRRPHDDGFEAATARVTARGPDAAARARRRRSRRRAGREGIGGRGRHAPGIADSGDRRAAEERVPAEAGSRRTCCATASRCGSSIMTGISDGARHRGEERAAGARRSRDRRARGLDARRQSPAAAGHGRPVRRSASGRRRRRRGRRASMNPSAFLGVGIQALSAQPHALDAHRARDRHRRRGGDRDTRDRARGARGGAGADPVARRQRAQRVPGTQSPPAARAAAWAASRR